MNDFEYYLEQSANDAKSFLKKPQLKDKVEENFSNLKDKIENLGKHMKHFNEDDSAFWDDAVDLLSKANDNIDDLLLYFKRDHLD